MQDRMDLPFLPIALHNCLYSKTWKLPAYNQHFCIDDASIYLLKGNSTTIF